MAVAVALGRFHQAFDFRLGQMLTGPQVLVGEPSRGNCSFYDGWRDQLEVRLRHDFRQSGMINCSYNAPYTNGVKSIAPVGRGERTFVSHPLAGGD